MPNFFRISVLNDKKNAFFFSQIDTPIDSEADVESEATSLDSATSPEKGFKGMYFSILW